MFHCVERQLGYQQAKYLMRIDVVARLDRIRGGKGGYWEDRGYEWYAGIQPSLAVRLQSSEAN